MTKELAKNNETAAPAQAPKNITDVVQMRVTDMMEKRELFMPANYSPENALKSAWLKLQEVEDKNHNKALQVCTRGSIMNSLLDMVVQGLTPAKNQCYFVVYGNQLTLMRSYMGTVAVAKRFSDVADVVANCIFEGDDFEFEIDPMTGLHKITRHKTSFENIDITKIKGAYAVVLRKKAEPYVEIMTMDQIKKAWGQGATKGGSPAHKNFTEEMAKKTVINRACKRFINTSDDSPVLVDAFNRTTESEYNREERTYYDAEADVIVDVEDKELTSQAASAIFGEPEAEPSTNVAEEPEETQLTEEEKAEIEAMEAAEALREEGERNAVDQR